MIRTSHSINSLSKRPFPGGAQTRPQVREGLASIVVGMAPLVPILPNERKGPDLATCATSRPLADEWIEFRPARWLVAALTLLGLWLARPRVGKRALLVVAWQFMPRRFKLIAGGAGALALLVLAGSVAVLLLTLNQIT
jgi:hypothetical protein